MGNKIRIAITVLVCLSMFAGVVIFNVAKGPLESSIAVNQVNDSIPEYTFSQFIAQGHIGILAFVVCAVIISLMWLPELKKYLGKTSVTMLLIIIIIISQGACSLHGCGPFKPEMLVEIKTNETAFLVPLEGQTKEGQKKFMSIEYLEGAKIATKRITIPVREKVTGRMPWKYEWIPTMKVVTVDRTPITREWTSDVKTGTNAKSEGIAVESQDSIGFSIGVNITAMITEDDASKFLYYYAGKPLSEVMDQNIRGFVQSVLGREFGKLPLTDCKVKKVEVFQILLTSVTEHFKEFGITTSNIGHAEGITFEDKEIQDAINKAFMAEQAITTATQQKAAQDQINEKNVSIAVAERKAAEEFAKAQEAQMTKIKLQIELTRAEAMKIAAEKWNGATPSSILPQGSQMLFGLDTSTENYAAQPKSK